jgi:hypothetical protein
MAAPEDPQAIPVQEYVRCSNTTPTGSRSTGSWYQPV